LQSPALIMEALSDLCKLPKVRDSYLQNPDRP